MRSVGCVRPSGYFLMAADLSNVKIGATFVAGPSVKSNIGNTDDGGYVVRAGSCRIIALGLAIEPERSETVGDGSRYALPRQLEMHLMCRWIAYSGNRVPMSSLITEPTHSLVAQSVRALE